MPKYKQPADVIKTDETAAALAKAVQDNPRETEPEKQLVDRLQECGCSPKTATEFAKWHRLYALPMLEWDAAERKRFLRGTSVEEIETQLRAANGGRKVRTLDLAEVLWLCKQARKVGYAAGGGGTVANSYKYPAEQTGCVVAVSSTGKLRVAIGVLSARKGASITNQLAGITARGTVEDFKRWADSVQVTATA